MNFIAFEINQNLFTNSWIFLYRNNSNETNLKPKRKPIIHQLPTPPMPPRDFENQTTSS